MSSDPTPAAPQRVVLFTLLSLVVLALPACDGTLPAPDASLPGLTVEDGASLVSSPDGRVTAVSGAHGSLRARTDGAPRFDLSFLPAALRPGETLTTEFIGGSGAPLATLTSRAESDQQHALAFVPGTVIPERVVVQARLDGRVVAAVDALQGADGFSGGTSFQEPTSVHYYWYRDREGGWMYGVEYDYDLHGGSTSVRLVGTADLVRADRVRFVVHVEDSSGPPTAVRLAGFDRLTLLPPHLASAAR